MLWVNPGVVLELKVIRSSSTFSRAIFLEDFSKVRGSRNVRRADQLFDERCVLFVFMSFTINRKRKLSCLLDRDFESSRYFECNQSSLSAERYYG